MGELFALIGVLGFYAILAISTIQCIFLALMIILFEKLVELIGRGVKQLIYKFQN